MRPRTFDGNGDDVVVVKDFDGAFRAAGAFRDDDDSGAALPRSSGYRPPSRRFDCGTPSPADRPPDARRLVNRQFLQARR